MTNVAQIPWQTLLVLLTAQLVSCISSHASIVVYPDHGYTQSSYSQLLRQITSKIGADNEQICIAHGQGGAERLLRHHRNCSSIVILGAFPSATVREALTSRGALIISGDLDGVSRFSRVAVQRHLNSNHLFRFAAVFGATHHIFANAGHATPGPVSGLDLTTELAVKEAHVNVASIVADFVQSERGNELALRTAESLFEQLAQPIILALQLEGSSQLGVPACNSDYPTNPKCQYPAWPNHSLPPGPNAPPNPPMPPDCICGSPWVENYANRMVAGLDLTNATNVTIETKNAFHDMSDVHPFHLAHIFNECNGENCQLNATTVSELLLKAGSLFPNATNASAPVSAYELQTKMKSRVAVWEAAGLGKQDSSLDNNMSICRNVNQAAYEWAVSAADPAVRARYEKDGIPMVMVDDKAAPIGIEGPEWIKDELVYTQIKDPTFPRVEVQAWQFVVSNTNGGNVPWFFPVGMHYCKLLSPARVMEYIYLDALRA